MKRLNSTAALALAALFLIAGCKTVGPDFEKPEAPRVGQGSGLWVRGQVFDL